MLIGGRPKFLRAKWEVVSRAETDRLAKLALAWRSNPSGGGGRKTWNRVPQRRSWGNAADFAGGFMVVFGLHSTAGPKPVAETHGRTPPKTQQAGIVLGFDLRLRPSQHPRWGFGRGICPAVPVRGVTALRSSERRPGKIRRGLPPRLGICGGKLRPHQFGPLTRV